MNLLVMLDPTRTISSTVVSSRINDIAKWSCFHKNSADDRKWHLFTSTMCCKHSVWNHFRGTGQPMLCGTILPNRCTRQLFPRSPVNLTGSRSGDGGDLITVAVIYSPATAVSLQHEARQLLSLSDTTLIKCCIVATDLTRVLAYYML